MGSQLPTCRRQPSRGRVLVSCGFRVTGTVKTRFGIALAMRKAIWAFGPLSADLLLRASTCGGGFASLLECLHGGIATSASTAGITRW